MAKIRIMITHPIRRITGVVFPGRIIEVTDQEAEFYIKKHWAHETGTQTPKPKKERNGKRKNNQ